MGKAMTSVREGLMYLLIPIIVIFSVSNVYSQACPTASAGDDDTLCVNATYPLSGIVTNESSILWSTNGGGTFDDEFIVNAIYTPGGSDLVDGVEVTLTLTAYPLPSCSDPAATDELILTMVAEPTADAGSDASICEGESYTVFDATANYYSSIGWAVYSGTGTLIQANTMTPNYTPSAGDITAGSAELIFYAYGNSPCGSSDSSIMVINITQAPDIYAGADAEICENDTYSITDATLSNYSSFIWSGGDGTFSDPLALVTTYTPGTGDLIVGSVELILNVIGNGTCFGAFSDTLLLTISSGPTVNAGSDGAICEIETFTVSTASASDYQSIYWVTSGTGTFVDETTLTPTYTPSAADILAGTVTLTFNGVAIFPCTGVVTDDMILTITPLPLADAGLDDSFCTTDTDYQMSGFATSYSSVSWSSSGTGSFTDLTSLTTYYTPSAADIASGSVTLTLLVNGTAGCSSQTDSDDMVLTIVDEPTANAGVDASVCSGLTYDLTGIATNYAALSWSTSGDGTFVGSNTLTPTYTPGTNDIAGGSVTLTLTASAISPCTIDSVDAMVLTIVEEPITSAGTDQGVCGINSISLTEPVASSYSSLLWTTSGTGTYSDATILNPVYTPSVADLASGTITLTITGQPLSPCAVPASDFLILTLTPEPTVYAGLDAEICETDTYLISDATASNYSSVLWTTSGDGSFTDPTSVTTTYIPGVSDIATGSANLTLSVYGAAYCSSETVQDILVLTISPNPIVDAGQDEIICEIESISITTAIASDYQSLNWQTSGTGSFASGTTLTPTYTPSAADITAGTVTLTMEAVAISPCIGNFTDDMVLTISPLPAANAGADDSFCTSDVTYQLAGNATDYSSVNWSTSGTGSFTDQTTLTAIYTPSVGDLALGSVTLTITANGIAGCSSQTYIDDMVLTIIDEPTAATGPDDTICSVSSIILSGVATNYTSVNWTTSGDGSFTDGHTLTPTYTPGTSDISNGNVILSLTALSIAPCTIDAVDAMTLSITPLPVVDAGPDDNFCTSGVDYQLAGIATDYSGVLWGTSGTGTFINQTSLTALYTASAGDKALGSVTLTATVTGIGECSAQTDNDFMVLTFMDEPSANAGIDDSVCSGLSITLSGTANDYTGLNWATLGDGSFADGTTLTPTYSPGAGDIANGSVSLTLTAYAALPCTNDAVDTLELTIIEGPITYAGTDQGICGTNSISLTEPTASSYLSLLWTTSGSGTYSDATILNPVYTPSVADLTSGTITLTITGQPLSPCAVPASDFLTLTLTPEPVAYAGLDAEICETDTYLISDAIASNYSSVIWTGGDGSFTDPTSVTTIYIPGAVDIITGNVNLVLSVSGAGYCSSETVQDTLVLVISPNPTVDAGQDEIICEIESVSITTAIASNFQSLIWQTSGTGFFTSGTTLNPTYTPSAADITAGTVTLTLDAVAISPCIGNFTDDMVLAISPLPIANAGIDDSLCTTDVTYQLAGIATDYSSINWSTSGTGSFTDQTTLTAIYTPSAGDILLGSVTLTITANGIAGCSSETGIDDMVLTITEEPTAYAGMDDTICTGSSIILSGVATDYTSVSWTTSGDGSFVDDNTLTPTYTPGAVDIINGSVTLSLTALSIAPCTIDAVDAMTLTITPLPLVDAGPDDDFCTSGTNYQLAGSATDYSAVVWSTSGTGTFVNQYSLTALYAPSTGDATLGSVTLTVTVDGMGECSAQTDSDFMVLTFMDEPSANAGIDDSVCSGLSITLSGTANDYTGLNWITLGDGSFIDATTLTPTYTPGTGDIANGSVSLTLTAFAALPCTVDAVDTLDLAIIENPLVTAGNDQQTCGDNSITLSEPIASDYSSLLWETTGTGSFSDATVLNPDYTPSSADVALGTITLVITAQPNSPCAILVQDSLNLTLVPVPIYYAGADNAICEGNSYSISDGTVTNVSVIIWSTSGDGAFDDESISTPTYSPGTADISSGVVTLTMSVVGLDVCTDTVTDNMVLTIDGLPIAVAGINSDICEGDIYTTSGTVVNSTSYGWTTSGTGTFDDPANLITDYIPSAADIINGTVSLTLTALPVGTCAIPADSTIELTIILQPTTDAGPDTTICEGSFLIADAYFTNFSSILWTTNGDGSFDDNTLLNPVYTPGVNDIGYTVILSASASPNAPCTVAITDEFELTVSETPVVYAGADADICEVTSSYTLIDATATGATSYEWISTGSGTFIDNTILAATYQPSAADILNGGVTLSLIGINMPCTHDSSFMFLAIYEEPTSEAGADSVICESGTYTLSGIANNALSVLWTTSGDGSFDDTGLLTATYTPGSNDKINETVDLWLTAYSIAPCEMTDIMTLAIQPLPTVDAGPNGATCGNDSYTLTSVFASDYQSTLWTTTGDGVFDDPNSLLATYTPGIADETFGSVSLILEAVAFSPCNEVVSDTMMLAVSPCPVADFTYNIIVCDSLQFTDLSTSSPGYNIVTWDWDFDDGGTSNLQNPTHQYPHSTTPGGEVYYVKLVIAADSLGFICTDSIILQVTVPSLPDIFFTWSPDPTCIGDSTYFYGESGYPIDIWHWDFDDGNFSLDSNAVHKYAITGTYNVVLNITDTNGCVNTLSDIVTVDTIPEVSFTMSDSVVCHGGSISFFGTGSNDVIIWYWEFGDGSFSYDQNPTHFYPGGGTYTVSLTAITASGCSTTTTDQVLILPGPTADYTYANLTCSSVVFTDLSTAPPGYNLVEWFWDFDDGFTATVQNPSHSFAGGIGVYDVMLIVTADSSGYSCTDTIIQTVLTPGLPTVFFTWTPEPTMLGDATSFFGTSGNTIVDWYWDFGDGNFATTQDATNTFATVGTFNVELTVTDIDGCVNSIIHQVTVTNVPELDFTWNYSCQGDPVQFTVLDPPTDIPAVVSWSWGFGDGGVSTDMDPVHVYITASTYSVSLTIVDTTGATNTVVKSITVNPLPTALFSIESPTCEGNPVQFNDFSITPTGFITEWIWDFGDGNTTTVAFPVSPDVTHIYASTGTYIVTLTVTNSDSCSNSTQNPVTTIPSPIATFTHSSGCASGPVSFTDTSMENGGGTLIAWNWDFDDPASGSDNTSTLQNPVHQFTASGDYDVQLIITNINGCSDTTITTVTVGDEPEVDFTYADGCLGSETQFEVDEAVTNVGEVQTWAWAFGDGGTSSLQNPTHTYDATGDYTVTLVIVTIDGCSASITHTVYINPLPNPNFEHTGPACLNDTVYFTDLSSSPNGLITSWHWDFGDGTEITIEAPNNPDVSHIYTNDATFAVALTTIDSDSCENTVVKNVEIVPSPIADYTFEETCYDEPVYFTDLSTTNGGTDLMSWEWFFGDPNSGVDNYSTLQNPTHVFSEPGTYITTLIIVSTVGCNDTTEQEITVEPLPEVDFTILDDSICLGESAEFTGISANEISTWFWDFGDGGYSIEQNPSYTYGDPGTYIVTLTVTEIGPDECQASVSHTIIVNDAPEANFAYENTCIDDSTYFTDLSYSQNGFIVGWEWNFGDGSTSTEVDPIHYYQDNDEYMVTLISMDNYECTDTITQWIQVFDKPVPNFTFDQVCEPNGQVNFFDESEPGEDGSPIVGWNWNLYDGYYSTEIDPSYIYPQTDTCYTVILEITDGNGCIATDTNEQVCLHGTLEIDFTSTQECLGTPTFFQASYDPPSDSVASYTWNFNDGSPLEVTYHDTIMHVFPSPGMFMVELMALDTNGCSTITHHEVLIDSLPTPQFTNTIGSCDNPILFTDISLGGGEFIESWYWDFGDIGSGADNYSTEQDPQHLYGPYDSIYQVKLIVTNFNGCIDSIVQGVYVEPCLVANFELPEGLICARYNLCFTDTSELLSNNGGINQWQWDFGDGETYSYSTHQNPICHTYQDAGEYEVVLVTNATINGTNYNDTAIQILTVNPTPLAGIIVASNCLGDSTEFYDDSEPNLEPITMWQWSFGEPSSGYKDTSFLQDSKHLYSDYGSYIYQLLVMNDYGCRDSITDTLDIYQLPEAAFSYEETCQSNFTYFTDESTGDGSDIIRYKWDFGDPNTLSDTSNIQDPGFVYEELGDYTVVLKVFDENQCYDSISHEIEIYPVPTSNFIIMDTVYQGQIYLDNTSVGGTSYYWDFDYDYGVSSTETDPIHKYEVDGNYNIMLISYNEYGCQDTTFQLYDLLFTNLFVPNAFVPSNINQELRVFKPKGINLRSYRLEIYSVWGNMVFQSSRLEDGSPAEGWDGTFKDKPMPTGSFIWRISAVFENGKHWKGTDNGDGNINTSGTVTLIR